MKQLIGLLALCSLFSACVNAQPLNQRNDFTRQDTLRGTINPYRNWWNVLHYDISVTPDFNSRTIKGINIITVMDSAFGRNGHTMQLDLQDPMTIDKVLYDGKQVSFKREKNVYWIYVRDSLATYRAKPGVKKVEVHFSGVPRPALNAPWDGGWIWKKDEKGRPFISVACQGLGASVWFPCLLLRFGGGFRPPPFSVHRAIRAYPVSIFSCSTSSIRAMVSTSSGVVATRPCGTGTPYLARISLP